MAETYTDFKKKLRAAGMTGSDKTYMRPLFDGARAVGQTSDDVIAKNGGGASAPPASPTRPIFDPPADHPATSGGYGPDSRLSNDQDPPSGAKLWSPPYKPNFTLQGGPTTPSVEPGTALVPYQAPPAPPEPAPVPPARNAGYVPPGSPTIQQGLSQLPPKGPQPVFLGGDVDVPTRFRPTTGAPTGSSGPSVKLPPGLGGMAAAGGASILGGLAADAALRKIAPEGMAQKDKADQAVQDIAVNAAKWLGGKVGGYTPDYRVPGTGDTQSHQAFLNAPVNIGTGQGQGNTLTDLEKTLPTPDYIDRYNTDNPSSGTPPAPVQSTKMPPIDPSMLSPAPQGPPGGFTAPPMGLMAPPSGPISAATGGGQMPHAAPAQAPRPPQAPAMPASPNQQLGGAPAPQQQPQPQQQPGMTPPPNNGMKPFGQQGAGANNPLANLLSLPFKAIGAVLGGVGNMLGQGVNGFSQGMQGMQGLGQYGQPQTPFQQGQTNTPSQVNQMSTNIAQGKPPAPTPPPNTGLGNSGAPPWFTGASPSTPYGGPQPNYGYPTGNA